MCEDWWCCRLSTTRTWLRYLTSLLNGRMRRWIIMATTKPGIEYRSSGDMHLLLKETELMMQRLPSGFLTGCILFYMTVSYLLHCNVKSSHFYLYSAFNNTNCNKATAQCQNWKIVCQWCKRTRFQTQFSAEVISLLNLVMASSSLIQFK